MTIAATEYSRISRGIVELQPRESEKLALALAAQAAAESRDAKVYSLLSKQVQALDLDAEFAALAADSAEWATATFEAGAQIWPAE